MQEVKNTLIIWIDKIIERYFNIFSADHMTNKELLGTILYHVHDKNYNKLNFENLMSFSDNDFCHDVLGLYCHTDLVTFETKDLFEPRCGWIPYVEEESHKRSFKVSSIDANDNDIELLYEITVKDLSNHLNNLDGFVSRLKDAIVKHGMYPCLKPRIIKENKEK